MYSIFVAIFFLFLSILNFYFGIKGKKENPNSNLAKYNIIMGVLSLITFMIFGGLAYMESRPLSNENINFTRSRFPSTVTSEINRAEKMANSGPK